MYIKPKLFIRKNNFRLKTVFTFGCEYHNFQKENNAKIILSDPEGFSPDTTKVVPLSVPESSICINGTPERFNITWSPDTSVNYGTTFYLIRVNDGDEVYNLVRRGKKFTSLT